MTEAEYLSSNDPGAMLDFVYTLHVLTDGACLAISDRKLRLFADACRDLRCCAMRFDSPVTDADHHARCDYGSPDHRNTRAALLREIAGNLWRPRALPFVGKGGTLNWRPGDPARRDPDARCPWLAPIVLSIAQAAHDERGEDGTLDPQRLAILADALEDAGCSDEAILWHLRGRDRYHAEPLGWTWRVRLPDEPHVRGCWVLDLLLGKS